MIFYLNKALIIGIININNFSWVWALSKSLNIISSVPGVIEDIQMSKIQYSRKSLRTGHTTIEELVDSIKAKGLLQPIVVRPKDAHFEIVAGNRRCKACEVLRWKKITCHVVNLDDKQAFEASLIENIQSKTLAPIEEAQAYKIYVADYGYGGVSELARKIGKSPSYITKRIKLLNLPDDVIDLLTATSPNASVAEDLFSVNDRSKQSELADLIIRRHLSIKKARELVDQYKDGREYFTYDRSTENSQRIFDKLILVLRIALNNVSGLINESEEEWVVREVLMHHKNKLHQQIDLLMKEKHKLDRRLLTL